MPGNSFGQLFRLTTFGESHGQAIGLILDGCPAGLEISAAEIQAALDRRKPGQSAITTQRKESDTVEILSGIFEGRTLGTPIGMLIRNSDQRSKDYEAFRNLYRPSHADYTWEAKYGTRDHRGGGRSSARETACRVAAGALASKLLSESGIEIAAWVDSVADIAIPADAGIDMADIDSNIVRCPHAETAERIIGAIEHARDSGDSLGGIIRCRISGSPAGLGEPVFDRLEADLAKAMLCINAVKGFDIGSGFAAADMKGSEHNDAFTAKDGKVQTQSNHSGGVQGGISNGMDIEFRVAFKPVATIGQAQQTVDRDGNSLTVEGKGRHDPCVLPRAVPIVEAMAALVLADHYLRNRSAKLNS